MAIAAVRGNMAWGRPRVTTKRMFSGGDVRAVRSAAAREPASNARHAAAATASHGVHDASEAASGSASPGSVTQLIIEPAPGAHASDGASNGAAVARPAARAHLCPRCHNHYSAEMLFCPFDGEPLSHAPLWDPSADPLVGQTIGGRFAVEAAIAEGGMGTVYRVRHTALGNAFAMKVLRRDLAHEPDLVARLVAEARATAAVGHPNIVAVTDYGEITSEHLPELGALRLPYFVMELVTGQSLAELLRAEGRIEPGRLAALLIQCASALEAAHAAGIIHRDLKPDNIRLSKSELGEEVAKVLDFGVAKVIGSSRRTQVGMVFGTPHYMSPEQGQGQPVDARTDIYALGVIAYECLSGKVPFAADTYMGVVTKHLYARPEPIASPQAAALVSVAMRCLEKRPEDRFASMADLVQALERARTGVGVAGRRDKIALRAREPSLDLVDTVPLKRAVPRWAWALAVLLGAGLAAVAFVVSGGAGRDAEGTAKAVDAAENVGNVVPSAQPNAAASASVARAEPGPPNAAASSSSDDGSPATSVAPSSAAPSASAQPSAAATPSTALVNVPPLRPPVRNPPPPPHKPPTGGDVVDPWRH